MILIESIELNNDGIAQFGVSTYNAPIVATIRNPENLPDTWNYLGRLYKVVNVNLSGVIRQCIADERPLYINRPSLCDYGLEPFLIGFLPARWLYSKADSRLFLDIYS